MGDYYYILTRRACLESAWRKVREKGLQSASKDIRAEVLEFDSAPTSRLASLQMRLIYGTFSFGEQIAVAKTRPGKTPRPIVIAPLENRIVQRAILDVMHMVPDIADMLGTPTSFGGIEGTERAIALVMKRLREGARWYLRSDIPGFFKAIPKPTVSAFVREAVDDELFSRLFDQAITVELANSSQFSAEEMAIFPIGDTGVAQGSSLSPLVGNLILQQFDYLLNARDVTCVRYIDDFLILGPSRRQVVGAFAEAKRLLAEHGLGAYDPDNRPDKAAMGEVASGFDFLGCSITSGLVQPSKKARQALLARVREIVDQGIADMRSAKSGEKPRGQRAAQTRDKLDHVIKGWGDAFKFCNGQQSLAALDRRVDQELKRLEDAEAKLLSGASLGEVRRIQGVHLLSDTKLKPARLSERGL